MPALAPSALPGFSHTIQVDKNLIRLLSDQTYTSFTNCLRELIVNAYDADASVVSIQTDIPHVGAKTEYAGSLRIDDNGHGMNVDEFIRMTRIAPGRMPVERSRRYGRPRVGRFGIGYLAAFPFCQTMEIRTRIDTDKEIVATFDCASYFKKSEEFVGLERVPVEARVERQRLSEFTAATGTSIILRGLTPEARRHLTHTHAPERKRGRKVESIHDWPAKERIAWELGQVLPIPWPAPYDEWQERLGIERQDNDPGLSVRLDGKSIQKPWPDGDHLLNTLPTQEGRDHYVRLSGDDQEPLDKKPVGDVFAYRLLVITPHKPIEPKEFRGVQFRLRGVGLGPPLPYRYIPGFLEKDNALVRSTVEVHLTGGFDRLLLLDRSHIKRGSWAYALFEDLARRIMASTDKRNLAEARINKSIEKIKKGEIVDKKEDIRRHAEVLGYVVQEDDISTEDVEIDHERQTISLPKKTPNSTIQLGGREWEVITGDPLDASLRNEWIRIEHSRQLLISPSLRERAGKTLQQFQRLLHDLARVEYQRFQLSQGRPAAVVQGMRDLATAIKGAIVNDADKR